MKEKFKFHEDPGHGWVEVNISELVALGIQRKISRYSYRYGNVCYLEEDCDAPLWLEAMKSAGREVELVFVNYPRNEAPLRKYPNYYV